MSATAVDTKKPRGRTYAIAGVLLAVQATLYYSVAPAPSKPLRAPLVSLPSRLGDWQAVRDTPISDAASAVLRADDTLNRDYFNSARNSSANLFIAYFSSQQQGRSPHSPQHCMPGAGWDQRSLSTVAVPVASFAAPIRINRFILGKGDQEIVVHYWYESHNRVIASEYLAKIYLVMDSIRYRRSDTSLVRVITTVPNAGAMDASIEEGVRFVQACFDPVRQLVD